MRILVTGATGLIGRRLIPHLLQRGETVLPLSRKPIPSGFFGPGSCEPAVGDPTGTGAWTDAIGTCDAVVHLAGEPIMGKRWNDAVLKELLDSRVDSTRLIAETLARHPNRADGSPKVFVSGSAVGYYGANPGVGEQRENSPPGSDALARICIAWEAAAEPAARAGVRVAHPRTGIVLDLEGGALPTMVRPFKLFAGGRIGSGKQYVPWIHREDMTGLLLHLLDTAGCRGAFNACAPNPVTNAEFSAVLGRVLRRPNWLPVPRFAIRVLLGKVAAVVVGGQRAIPTELQKSGFTFRFPDLEAALRDLLLWHGDHKPDPTP